MKFSDLAAARAKAKANFEYLKGWDKSSDPEERYLYAQSKGKYHSAEMLYQRALVRLTPEARQEAEDRWG